MILSKKANTISEYAVMFALIGMSILIGGPLLVATINALFYGVQRQADEAKKEVSVQAGVPDLGLGGCTASPFEFEACGTGGSNSCALQMEKHSRTFSPPGCEAQYAQYEGADFHTYECQDNESYPDEPICCTEWEDMNCGTNDDPINCCGVIATNGTNDDGTCPDGTMNQERICGSQNVSEYRCNGDGDCNFFCTGEPVNSDWCEDDNIELTQTLATLHVLAGDCTEDRKCEAECLEGWVADGGSCSCGPGAFSIKFSNWAVYNNRFRSRTHTISGTYTDAVSGDDVPGAAFHKDNHTIRWAWNWNPGGTHFLDISGIRVFDENAGEYRLYGSYDWSWAFNTQINANFTTLTAANCPWNWYDFFGFGNRYPQSAVSIDYDANGVPRDGHAKNGAVAARYDSDGYLTDILFRSCCNDNSDEHGVSGNPEIVVSILYECLID